MNVLQGRPARAIPQRIGKTELAAFVILPALLPLIFGGQVGSAATTIGANLLLLALIYAVFVYGLLAILRWVFARLAGQLRSSLGLLANAVPLLAIFALLSFASQEMWQIFGTLSAFAYFCTIGLFVAARQRLPRRARPGRDPAAGARGERRRAAAVALAADQRRPGPVRQPGGAGALRERLHRRLLRPLRDAGDRRGGAAPRGSATGPHAGHDLASAAISFELTSELLRVAGGLAAFSGFYFAVAMLTDSTYREEFLAELTEEMGTSFRARVAYLRLRAAGSVPV